ncbi:hypothetical protein N7466_010611 [Penicillium verhagenii]|uniref:uncharacterized protein n=1 Tax=Penicillium verhagenii TaxID=1562060 RepID=UPI0025452E55|nr:uncharacterized protein N7466_010611 [Penicillium verhagenii]KAJ5918619.1 hypothetical protein N7466_010611 [Penicillium verhagenii]
MASSRLRNRLSRFQNRKARWPHPEQSAGDLLGEKGENCKFNYWGAIGPVKEVFEEMRPLIKELLQNECEEVRSLSAIQFEMFMVGDTPETATPFIMFSCWRAKPRKDAVAAMKKSDVYNDSPPGIMLGQWQFPPHLINCQFEFRACAAPNESFNPDWANKSAPSHREEDCISIPDLNEPGICHVLQLSLSNTSTEPAYHRTATIGSIVTISDRRFWIYPAHVGYLHENNSLGMGPEPDSTPEDRECVFEFFDEEEDEQQDPIDADFMSAFSATPEQSDLESDPDSDDSEWLSDIESGSIPSIMPMEGNDYSIASSSDEAYCAWGHSKISSSLHSAPQETNYYFLKSDSLDYCLMEVNDVGHDLPDLPILCQENIGQLGSQSADVTAATSSGNILKGVLSPQLSCIRLPNAARYTDILSVKFDSPVQPGDSGSMVRDARTGMIYGQIIAGDAGSKIAIIIPAADILNDAMTKFMQIGETAVKSELATSTHEREPKKNHSENEESFGRDNWKLRSYSEHSETGDTTIHLRKVPCFSLPRPREIPPHSEVSVFENCTLPFRKAGKHSFLGFCKDSPKEYNVAWICALSCENLAAEALLNEPKDTTRKPWTVNRSSPREAESVKQSDSERRWKRPFLSRESTHGYLPGPYEESFACYLGSMGPYPINIQCQVPHQTYQSVRCSNVKDKWLLDGSQFQTWKSETKGSLWLPAKPGCGKQLLSQILLDSSLPDNGLFQSFGICQENDMKHSVLTANWRALTWHPPAARKDLYCQHTIRTVQRFSGQPKLVFDFLLNLDRHPGAAHSSVKWFCIVDGLDECEEPKRDRPTKGLSLPCSPIIPMPASTLQGIQYLKRIYAQNSWPAQLYSEIQTAASHERQAPLSCAARNGHNTTVQMLLDTGKVDIKTKFPNGQTPLSCAIQNAHNTIIQMLLDTGKVDIKTKFPNGQTPLSCAIQNAHNTIIQMLLDTGKVDIKTKFPNGQTPLSCAIQNAHNTIIQMLLDTGKVDIKTKFPNGQTPLSCAIQNAHNTIIQMLLDTGKVDVDAKDKDWPNTAIIDCRERPQHHCSDAPQHRQGGCRCYR